jgi:hypothetical protein
LAMTRFTHRLRTLMPLVYMLLTLLCDGLRFLCLRPSPALAAEKLFLCNKLAPYQERHVKPQRPADATRLVLVWLARCFDWRQALVVVQPTTFISWHRQGFRLFWRWKSAPGHPPIPPDLQALIRRMACENATWGEELRVLNTPVGSPQANALCERLLGTLRRECLDFLIPLTDPPYGVSCTSGGHIIT